jgi:hypothetical protein
MCAYDNVCVYVCLCVQATHKVPLPCLGLHKDEQLSMFCRNVYVYVNVSS